MDDCPCVSLRFSRINVSLSLSLWLPPLHAAAAAAAVAMVTDWCGDDVVWLLVCSFLHRFDSESFSTEPIKNTGSAGPPLAFYHVQNVRIYLP